jgi:hypothetical protein
MFYIGCTCLFAWGLPSRGRLEWKLLVAGTHILIKIDECVSKHFFTYIIFYVYCIYIHIGIYVFII